MLRRCWGPVAASLHADAYAGFGGLYDPDPVTGQAPLVEVADRVPVRGVAGVDRRDAGQGRFGQVARTGRLTSALSPSGAMVSRVM